MNYAEGVTAAHPELPLVIGHRGASGYRPEHTRSAYVLAIEQGADAVEPDVVMTKDGVAVVCHDNELSTTTNVRDFPEFASRRTSKTIDGKRYRGWFTEDFTWEELSRLRCRERLPGIRPESAAFDDEEPMLRLTDLLEILDAQRAETGRDIGLVLEVKHPTYFEAIGLPMAETIARDLAAHGWADGTKPLWIECFELQILRALQELVVSRQVFLIDNRGAPADLVAEQGTEATPFSWFLTGTGIEFVAAQGFAGISVDKARLLAKNTIVADATERQLEVFVWTLRPENVFLNRPYRIGTSRLKWGNYAAEWQRIIDTGVAGIFADQPDLLVGLLAASARDD